MSFREARITYDEIGNPLTYYNGASYTFEWLGRRLMSASKGTDSLFFTYNTDGIRTSKTKNGVTTEYYLNGSDIVAEKTNGNMTLYVYGADGSVIGMMYHGASYSENQWDVFWFEKNMQGDIVAIYNEAGAKLVTYTYDAWGSFSRTYHNDGQNTAAANNPFTYRGYYYDYDLKFYYLNSRYYDPYVGRFINSDSLIAGNSGSIHGHNLFVYCFNNPANMTDSEGNWGESIKEWLIDKANTLYYNATKWHFEDRIEANGEHPTHEEVNETNSDWRLLPKSESLYHIDDVGKDELKYVHPDGREAVFNGDTLEPMTDPRYMGTYNYVTIQELPENAEYRDYIAVAGSYVGHFFADVLPYYLTLKSNTREQFEEKIIAIFD